MRQFTPGVRSAASGLLPLLLPLALLAGLASASVSSRVLEDAAARGRARAERNDRFDSDGPKLRAGPANVTGTYHGEH